MDLAKEPDLEYIIRKKETLSHSYIEIQKKKEPQQNSEPCSNCILNSTVITKKLRKRKTI